MSAAGAAPSSQAALRGLGPSSPLAAPGGRAIDASRRRRAGEMGVLLLIAAEGMLFAGLLSAYLVFRASAPLWPPLGQPRLPVGATAFNTALLLLSLAVLPRGGHRQGRGLWLAWGLGAAFLLLQGREWLALVADGLKLGQGPYGAFFTLIVATHGLHCLAGLAWLGMAAWLKREEGLRLAGWFWAFVVLLWPVLYGVVYLW